MHTRRELLKEAFVAKKNTEALDQVDALMKIASLDETVEKALLSNKKIGKILGKLDDAGKMEMMAAMKGSVGLAPPTGFSGKINEPLQGYVGMPVRSALESAGIIPSSKPTGMLGRVGSVGGKILGTALPTMVAGAGLYGLDKLVKHFKEKSEKEKFESSKQDALARLLKDNPAMRSVPKDQMKQIFDAYADVSPLVTKHPIIASAVMEELGSGGKATVAPQVLKQLADIWSAREKAKSEVAKSNEYGWYQAARDPQKLRNLIGDTKWE